MKQMQQKCNSYYYKNLIYSTSYKQMQQKCNNCYYYKNLIYWTSYKQTHTYAYTWNLQIYWNSKLIKKIY